MIVSVNKCPQCQAPIEIPANMTSIFCKYCGCQMYIERDPTTEEIIRIKEIDARIREADAKIREADAIIRAADAKMKEADVKVREADIRYQKAKISERIYRDKKKTNTKGIVLGLLAGFGLTGGSIYVTMLVGFDNNYWEIFICFGLMGIILLFYAILSIGEGSKYLSPEDKRQIEELITELQQELKKEQAVILENSGSIFGIKAKKRKYAKERIREIKEKIDRLKYQLGEG